MKILIIDDDAFFAENLCEFIKQFHDVDIDQVGKISDAIQRVSQKKYDLIITDVQLIDEREVELLLEIEKIKPGQPIIVTSSYNVTKEPGLAEKINLIGYLEKPFNPKIIVNLINQLIHSSQNVN